MLKKVENAVVSIPPPNFLEASFAIEGTKIYLQDRFSKEAQQIMRQTQGAGSTARTKKKRDAKNFDALFEQAQYKMADGARGIPCTAFRNSMISACKAVGFVMTRGKIGVFVEADGMDCVDNFTELVRITRGEPQKHEAIGRNADGSADIRVRAAFAIGWRAVVRIRFDGDMFTLTDIANLLSRAGMQVGIGSGRPDSKNSPGLGIGLFRILNEEQANG